MTTAFRRLSQHLPLSAGLAAVMLSTAAATAGAEGSHAPIDTALQHHWLAEDIFGGGVMDYLRTVLEIGPDGQVSGNGGCNAISGTVQVEGSTLRFANLVSTQKLCTPAAMDQERKFFDALEAARGWSVDAERRKLMLDDGDGRQIAVFAEDG